MDYQVVVDGNPGSRIILPVSAYTIRPLPGQTGGFFMDLREWGNIIGGPDKQ